MQHGLGMELKFAPSLANHQLGHITGAFFTYQKLVVVTLSKTQNEVTAQVKLPWGQIGTNFNFILMGRQFYP